jgi:hypothetical protein
VPDHQGQEVLGAALLEKGYSWVSEFTGGRTHLIITDPGGGPLDREDVRAILAGQHRASLSGPDIIYTDVRFEDEPEGREPARMRTPGTPPVSTPAAAEHVASPDDEPPGPRRRRGLGAPLLRVAVGAALLTFPRAITDALVPEADAADRVLARLLGARHLLQAVVTAARPTPVVLVAGAATDALHGTTALTYAAVSPEHRRAALLSASVAFAFAVADVRRARA